jgi:hypothetical protein
LKTGKGRSFFPLAKAPQLETWTAKPVFSPELDLYYLPAFQGKQQGILEYRLEGKDTLHKRWEPIHFAIGSGNQARSYLYERNGYLYEHPLTWYRKKAIWELSPGYEGGLHSRFSRAVGAECMSCHVSGFQAIPNSENRYTAFGNALDCGSCHGDLSGHLTQMKKGGKADPGVLRLGKLPVQAQLDVCRQCHLEGVKVRKTKAPAGDYVPGKLFSTYYEVFIPGSGESDFGFASHAERMQLSACFQGSGGKMTCGTCHDPHAALPADAATAFSAKCQTCHSTETHGKMCPKAGSKKETTKCISCHMHRDGTNDIPHVTSTDHWIRKHPQAPLPAKGNLRFRHFAGTNPDPKDRARAMLNYAETRADTHVLAELRGYLQLLSAGEKWKFQYLSGKVNLADSATLPKPYDLWTRFYLAEGLKKAGLPHLEPLQKCAEAAPDMLEFQYRLALARTEAGEDPAKAYAEVLKRDPLHVKSRSNLGYHALQQRAYPEAETHLKAALQQDPDFILARENLARCYLEQGKFAESRKLLNRLIRDYPQETRYRMALQAIP